MLSKEVIVIIIESAVVVALIAILAIIGIKARKKKKANKDAVYIKKGERYTYGEETSDKDGAIVITHTQGDVILEKGITYIVRKDGKIIPGKYTMLAAQENTPLFNVRLGDFVREYSHETDIVLSEGESICAVSHSVILR